MGPAAERKNVFLDEYSIFYIITPFHEIETDSLKPCKICKYTSACRLCVLIVKEAELFKMLGPFSSELILP
jgi:hypothetical protein